MAVLVPLALALLGVPLFAVLAVGAYLGYWQAELDPSLVMMEILRISEHGQLAALPLFAFCSILIIRSGLPQRLWRVQQSIAGLMALGGAVTSLLLFVLAGALTGLSALLLTAIGAAAASRAGKEGQMPTGLMNAGLSTGLLIAPSSALLLLAAAAGQLAPVFGIAPETVYFAALLPALLIFALAGGLAILTASEFKACQSGQSEAGAGKRAGIAWELPLPFVLVGGIYTGSLDVTEAGLLATVWLAAVLVLVRREVRASDLPAMAGDAVVWSAAIILLLAISLVASGAMTDAGVPQQWLSMLHAVPGRLLLFWMMVVLVAAWLGMLVEVPAAVAVAGPLLIPLGVAFGVHPVQLCVVVLMAVQIGHLLSPLGSLDLPATEGLSVRSVLSRADGTFIALFAMLLAVVLSWPGLTLWGLS